MKIKEFVEVQEMTFKQLEEFINIRTEKFEDFIKELKELGEQNLELLLNFSAKFPYWVSKCCATVETVNGSLVSNAADLMAQINQCVTVVFNRYIQTITPFMNKLKEFNTLQEELNVLRATAEVHERRVKQQEEMIKQLTKENNNTENEQSSDMEDKQTWNSVPTKKFP